MKTDDETGIGRRRFLKGAGIAGAAAMAAPLSANAQPSGNPKRRVPPVAQAEAERDPPAVGNVTTQNSCGSDYMVDVMRHMGIQYAAAIPGNTFKGLHESIINYGMMSEPKLELITCTHEEISVALAHGYAKIEGKPMACMMHSTVGLQHGSMAIYNAWCDRAPVFGIVGAMMNGDTRTGYVSWVHSVFDGPGLVREFTKFDDTPASLPHFADSAARAYKFSMTPPYGPVVLALDEHLQEAPLPEGGAPALPKLPVTAPPQGEMGAVRETARMLVEASSPVILADRAARTPEGLKLMVELAEALQAPVVDSYGRMNFPWRHPLNQTALAEKRIAEADVILGLELTDFYGATQRQMKPSAKRVSISSTDVYMGSNYQDFNRFTQVDLALAADAEATLPTLIEEVRRQTSENRRSTFLTRGEWLANEHQTALLASRKSAARGWNAQPITTARLCAELYEKIRNDDWSLVNGTVFQNFWPQQLWTADKHYQYIGDSGAYGLGYLPGASVGAALANKRHGRLTVAIGGDGDFMFAPGALWTAAHHQIPLLYIIHNNGGYHQEIMWIQRMAAVRDRGVKDRPHIGNELVKPGIDFAKLAQSMGVHAEGPIRDPRDLGPALDRALSVVRGGQPALLDVISQGR